MKKRNPFDEQFISKETSNFNLNLEKKLKSLPATESLNPIDVRNARDEGKGIFPLMPPINEVKEIKIKSADGHDVSIRINEKKDVDTIFMFIHGGGWTFGRPIYEDHWCRYISNNANCNVGAIGYRLAPESPWPACLLDCVAAVIWAAKEGYKKIAIGGESAGAQLAVSTLLKLKEIRPDIKLCGSILTYGCFDLSLTPSARNWGKRKLVLSTSTIKWFVQNLSIKKTNIADPIISPLYGKLKEMPPALFQCGTLDPLIDDTAFMSFRWNQAGNDSRTIWYPGGVHAFDKFDLLLSKELKQNTINFLLEIFSS